MPEQVETIVIGGGQAGLSTSYHLTQRGREHVVLEQGEVANTWRTRRWDGFYLNTPNWTLQLPGHEYDGPDPDAFAPLAGAIAYLEGYARATAAPVRAGVQVTRVRQPPSGGWLVETNGEVLQAENVVVATGAFQRPYVPSAGVPTDVLQLHAIDYRRPEQLPPGAVLVVGSGQTGCQIAEELLGAGRTVYLSVGGCPWFPRRYRGHDILRWLVDIGMTDETVDTLAAPAARLACNPALSGNDGGHDCNPRTLARRGALLVGRMQGIDGARVSFAPGLEENLAKGDQFVATITSRIDDYLRASGTDAPLAEAPDEEPTPLVKLEQFDLRRRGVGTILWTTGYRPDFGWIDVPLSDEMGWPMQQRGLTAYPGLYFVGLNWMHKRKSALLFGVGEDAEYVVSQLAGE